MSTPQDPRTTPLQDDEAALARVLRALPAGEPPAALDAAILKAATDAISAPAATQRPRRLPTWALGTAAAAVLAVGIGSQLRPPMPVERAVAPAEPQLQALPAPPPEADLALPSAADAVLPAEAPARADAGAAERAEDATSGSAAGSDAQPAFLEPPPPAAPPAPPPPPPAPVVMQEPIPEASAAAPAPIARDADARRAEARTREQQAMARQDAVASERESAERAARAAAAEPAPADAFAEGPTAGAMNDAATPEAKASVPPAAAMAPPSAPRAALPPVAEDVRLAPADWLARIRERRDGGDRVGARASLVLFVRAHPDATIPDDLAGLRE